MTEDDLRKKVEFIVEQQAQFTADVQQLKNLQIQAEDRMTRLESIIVRLVEVVQSLTEAQQQTNESIIKLAEIQVDTYRKLSDTDDHLKNLIDVVERYIM